jgi:hypothetical protein
MKPNVPNDKPTSPSNPKQATHVISIPAAICSTCGNPYRPSVQRMATGKITGLILFCDTCFHGKDVSLTPINAVDTLWQPQPIPCPKCAEKGKVEYVKMDATKRFQCANLHLMEESEVLAAMHGGAPKKFNGVLEAGNA